MIKACEHTPIGDDKCKVLEWSLVCSEEKKKEKKKGIGFGFRERAGKADACARAVQ